MLDGWPRPLKTTSATPAHLGTTAGPQLPPSRRRSRRRRAGSSGWIEKCGPAACSNAERTAHETGPRRPHRVVSDDRPTEKRTASFAPPARPASSPRLLQPAGAGLLTAITGRGTGGYLTVAALGGKPKFLAQKPLRPLLGPGQEWSTCAFRARSLPELEGVLRFGRGTLERLDFATCLEGGKGPTVCRPSADAGNEAAAAFGVNLRVESRGPKPREAR